jgi:hypothetical protein
VKEALRWAGYVCAASPDAVQFTKEAMLLTTIDSKPDQEALLQAVDSPAFAQVQTGANIREGLAAFSQVGRAGSRMRGLLPRSDENLNGRTHRRAKTRSVFKPNYEMHVHKSTRWPLSALLRMASMIWCRLTA